jgi:hypothetical protein
LLELDIGIWRHQLTHDAGISGLDMTASWNLRNGFYEALIQALDK